MLAIEDIFRTWTSLADMAKAINYPYETVAKWAQRERIPSDAWSRVIEAAAMQGKLVTWGDLAGANKRRKSHQGSARRAEA